jgi:hypothetical protein
MSRVTGDFLDMSAKETDWHMDKGHRTLRKGGES